MNEKMKENMAKIMNTDELMRMMITTGNDGSAVVKLDLHQLDRKRAARLVRNTINVNRQPFTLRIIHGYHSGTVLKDLISEELNHKRIRDKISVPWNMGETYLRLA